VKNAALCEEKSSELASSLNLLIILSHFFPTESRISLSKIAKMFITGTIPDQGILSHNPEHAGSKSSLLGLVIKGHAPSPALFYCQFRLFD